MENTLPCSIQLISTAPFGWKKDNSKAIGERKLQPCLN